MGIDAWLLYLAVGACAGLLAGLLGVGGGLVIVPALVWWLPQSGVAETHAMHIAVGTSLASIVFTGTSSVWAHRGRGAVRWDAVHSLAPGLVLGALLGAGIADFLNRAWLSAVFVVFAALIGIKLLLDIRPEGHRPLPEAPAVFGAGIPMGLLSALVGIGGGSLSAPYFMWHRMRAQEAVATAAACGVPLAAAGASGFVIAGWNAGGLPGLAAGYVYFPALAAIVFASVLTAPLGARLAHALPASALRRVFGGLLVIIAVLMGWS